MAKNDITVEEFVKTKVLPEFQPIVGVLRKVLHKYAPDTREFMSYGIPITRVNEASRSSALRRRSPLLHQAGAGIRRKIRTAMSYKTYGEILSS